MTLRYHQWKHYKKLIHARCKYRKQVLDQYTLLIIIETNPLKHNHNHTIYNIHVLHITQEYTIPLHKHLINTHTLTCTVSNNVYIHSIIHTMFKLRAVHMFGTTKCIIRVCVFYLIVWGWIRCADVSVPVIEAEISPSWEQLLTS